ncbi:hypothetical protein VV867_15335 [Pseudomonas sp. JH-2]|uniref:hypothetical protein n=1 Tax=Pseudomonas sp. JH-2 TaxID=3114998 RepID=UPI002E265C56|nr:hypothetical protein [Pseudomonas sp. JH-2]
MNRLPRYADYVEPGEPRWRRWWLALLLLWGAQSGLLLTLWPEGRPRLELWLWGAVLPLSWGLALAVRALVWRIGLMNRDAYRQTIQAAEQRWWRKRARTLPVHQLLLLGPVGDVQAQYRDLMDGAKMPDPELPTSAGVPLLRCQLSRGMPGERVPMLARHLARLALALPERTERWPSLRGLAWVGDAVGEAAFVTALSAGELDLPATRFSLRTLKDLDALIDALPKVCPDETDGLLCAGVVSREQADEGEMPGEAGFLWVVGRKGTLRLHRGEYLLPEKGETASELCAQMQGYAGLNQAPEDCLALDAVSQAAFVEGGWTVGQHQLAEYWGALGELAPFVGMSLAALQAEQSGEPCGWLGKDDAGRLAMGVVVSHGG